MADKLETLHKNLTADGYNLGSLDDFRKAMSDSTKASNFHKNLSADGYKLGTQEEFFNNIGLGKQQETPKPQPTQKAAAVQQPAQTTKPQPTASYPSDFGGLKTRHDMLRQGIDRYTKQNKTKQVKGSTPLTAGDKAVLGTNAGNIISNARQINQRMSNATQELSNASLTGNLSAPLGSRSKLRKGKQKFNAETGQFEDTWLTQTGREHNSLLNAEQEQQAIDEYNNQIKSINRLKEWADVYDEEKKSIKDQIADAEAERQHIIEALDSIEKKERGEAFNGDILKKFASSWGIDNANGAQLPFQPKDKEKFSAALRQVEERLAALKSERDDDGLIGGMGRVLKPYLQTAGWGSVADVQVARDIQKKIDLATVEGEKPVFNDAEKAFIKNELGKQQALLLDNNRNWWFGAGKSLGNTLTFMADFAVTGGGFSGLAKGGLRMGTKAGMKWAGSEMANYLIKNLGVAGKGITKTLQYGAKYGGMAAGAEVAGLAQSYTVQTPKTLSAIAERNMGKLSVGNDGNLTFEGGEALGKSILYETLKASGENASELMGPAFDIIPGILGRVISKTTTGQMLKRFTSNKVWRGGEKTLNFLGVQGLWGEGMEEEYGMLRNEILNYITNGSYDPNGESITDIGNQLNTWATVGLTSGLLRGPQMAISGYQNAKYYAHKYNLNQSDKQMRNTFDDDERYQNVKAMLDNAQNKDFGNVLNSLIMNGGLSTFEKRTAVMYASDLIALRGFNIGNAVAAANGAYNKPRVSGYNISGNTIEEVDNEGNVIGKHEYDSREEMKSALWSMQQERANNDMQSDISIMKARPDRQYEILLHQYAAQAGVYPEEIETILNKKPMDRTDAEQQLISPFAKIMHDNIYDSSMLHEEQSAEDGQDIADAMDFEDNGASQADNIADVKARWDGANMARQQLFERDKAIAQAVLDGEYDGLSHQEIISSLSQFPEEETQVVIDYYNQKARFEGLMNRLNNKIDEEARNRRERRTFKGSINGVKDSRFVYTITDGTTSYTLVNGNIKKDAEGNITGSDSGMIIGVDENGDFVTIGDSEGFMVAPTNQTLDQYEEEQRVLLQEGVSTLVDPQGTMGMEPQQEVVQPQQEQVVDNVGGEADVNNIGADEPPTTTPTVSVDEKTGLKRYEDGMPVDDAINDMLANEFDVNELADAFIAEAQEQIDKINGKKVKKPQDIVERKRQQTKADYYKQIKKRYLELYPPYVDPQPYLDELKNAQSKTKADEILNRALSAGVKSEEIQPAHTEKVQEILDKQEEARKRAEEVTEKDLADIKAKSDTPEGRAWLLDRKRIPNAERRRKMAKLIYGDQFDDDFSAYRDIYELISMWLSKGRALDPDTFGQELGWDMGIGKDAAKVSTMFAAKRENGGDGILFNDFVHMVSEASEGRFDTQDVRNALIEMFQGAQEKSDLTEYQLATRVADAEKNLQAEIERAKDAEQQAEEPQTKEPVGEGMLPFPPATDEVPFGNTNTTEETEQQTEEPQQEEQPAEEPQQEEEEEQQAEAKEEPKTKWQYNFHYDKETGRAWIDRDDVSGIIPIGDGRWRIEANSLAELRAILENPKNNLGELLELIEPQLHNAEVGEELRNEAKKEEETSDVQNNDKSEDNSVNEHKEENNEAENVVSSQENTENLEGDSAEFAEREQKISMLNLKILDALKDAVFRGDIKLKTMQGVKALASELGLNDISLTDLQEIVEAQIVNLARKISEREDLENEKKFEYIRRLYEYQPTLSARDNDRINKQQYSTPAPMAFLMGQFVDPEHKVESGLEPSAGNGMLTVNLPKEKMHVNDIDEMRLSNLQKQGFGKVTSQDGTMPFEQKAYDVVVTNPPFGSTEPKDYDGYSISGLEHQMAINALDSMKDDGRAAIIIGGNTEYKDNGTIKGKDKAFFNYLYSHYNVVDIINIDGKAMYAKQGTGYNVRMILINGRKQADGSFAPVQSKARAEQVKSYDELYNRVNDDILSDNNKPASVHNTESGESTGVDDNRNVETPVEEGVRNVRTEGGSRQSEQRPDNGSDVSGSTATTTGNTTQGNGGISEGERNDVVGESVSNDGGRTETTEPSEPTSTGTEREQSESGRNDSERVSAEPSKPSRTEQRGAEPAQQTEQPESKRGLGTEKVPYNKQSDNPFTLQSLMPADQADEVKKTLEGLGDVDQFLVDELGYSSKDELHQALAAEQIDSVAMAIHQMNQGNAFIIGDQTGIGKGRQAAALIRYGVKKGGFPVFITVKKGLFSDMYRDLCDIGSPKLRPFIWSADDAQHSGAVTDKDGNVIYQMPSAKEQKSVVEYINQHGKLPKEYDYVLTTYDSFKSGTMDYENGQKKARSFGKKQPSAIHYNGQAKRDALERLAENSYVIMDESHNAGGEGSNVSNYLQYITTKAKGLTFLSATFAKRPGNMPIYSLKTAIAKAGVEVGELIDAVKRGGATFQEIMSKALTGAGQMIRRERDMTGVTIDWRGIEDEEVIQKQREQYDEVIGLFNQIINFQRTYVDPIIDNLNDEAAEEQGSVDHTPGTRDMGINNTPFASRTYNMVQQVLLSLKAEEAAKRAIEHLKNGYKPVITVANTNEGAADEVAAADGESMEMPDLSVNLKKGLRGTLRITSKDSNDNATNSEIPLEKLGEEGKAKYLEIMEAIENASTGLSLSPIDVIKNELKKAGYKVGELTGRKSEFIYNEDGTVKRVKRQDTDKKKVAADFNNGNLDALILNRSAGTGISLHASTKFKDQRQRIMIVAQAQGDVNDEVQIRGRIDRTGQVLRGKYEYVVSQIPSEQRLLMMLKAKLRSLDANTTSSQKSKFNEMDVQDIINKYGDNIVIQYLAEHPDTYSKLADPLKWGETVFVESAESLVASAQKVAEDGGTASKILGRMALLTVKEQEKMLDEIGEMYKTEIERLNEMGENDLEITEMPLKAKTLGKQVWEQGVEPGGKNPFADNTYVEKVEMDVLKKPMKASEVKAAQARLLGGKSWDEYKQGVLDRVDKWAENKKAETTETITARAKKKAEAEKEKYLKGAKKAQDKNQMTDEEIERNAGYQYDNFYKEEMSKLDNALVAIDSQKQAFVDALETFTTDGVYALPSNIYDLESMTFEPGFGKLIDIKINDNLSPTTSTMSFATLDGRRKITIPINGRVKQQKGEKRELFPVINSLTAQTKSSWFGANVANTLKVLEQNIDNWDKLTSTATRKEGYIITGNLLKALVSTREQGKGGKLISYTTDTGEVRQGILMPDGFEPAGLTSKTPISAKKEELKYNGDKVTSADGDVTIKVTNRWNWSTHSYDTLELSVPKSTKKGGKYFNDETLLSLVQGQFEGSSKMRAEFKMDNLDAVLKRLDELGVTVAEEHKEDSSSNRRYDVGEGNSKETQQKSRIASHIDSLLDKLGTKERTTVYHSFDELPEEDKDYVREMERKGRKVRGWYENGHIYLYLPHIDSEYQAEKTIWHETVAHHGLRELVGEENLNKLLTQLWLTHRDGEMGAWVTERMQKNGWKLNEAIEEYIAREAEKNPFKEPSLWQRIKWLLSDIFHKLGFHTEPTLNDVKYLMWVSQNNLNPHDPTTKIKRDSFLFKLRKESQSAPYVNMNASRVEDIYNPDAEDAYDDGTRYSEETDEEVIKRLESEPKIKTYRAMVMIDGKLYPPMSTKTDSKTLRNPSELGKWEKSDEAPEKAKEINGKWYFTLNKDSGSPVRDVAYNPYIHSSTTMLNDQFKGAEARPNLVVVEMEVPASELTSGYKADKAHLPVGKHAWNAGAIQKYLTGTREVVLSRWAKPVRIVPAEEFADHVANLVKGQVDVFPSAIVTPEQRAALEKKGIKFVKTDGNLKIQEGENKGKIYNYGKRLYDQDIDNPADQSAKMVYEERMNTVKSVFTEAYQDAMVSLKHAQNAIAKDKEIPDYQNAYMAENLMHGKNKNEQDLYNAEFRDPLIELLNKIIKATGMKWGDIDRYVYTKSGLERNREFFVRDNAGKSKNKNVLDDWKKLKADLFDDLQNDRITFDGYLAKMDYFILNEIDNEYKAEENDYSGFRAMFGDDKGNYDETAIISDLMDTEDMINDANLNNVNNLWSLINGATRYGLERYRMAGMKSDEQIDDVEQMFNFYVPMRGFKKETGEDMYQYFTNKGLRSSYVGGLLKHAKGRGSEANYPISTIFAMSYKAISDCNQNLVCQKLYRLCEANPNDLIILSDSWATLNPTTGEYEEAYPNITDDMSEEDIRQETIAFEEQMKKEEAAGNAKKIYGKAKFAYKPVDKRKKSEHIVEVRINGAYKRMTVVGNPRMAQALNGQLRFEHGDNVFSKWNAKIKNMMSALFTSYSPTFALRNMWRDWTHFRVMLGVREGNGYASAANGYYRKSLFKMVGLFKKYRNGTLDTNKEIERDFKDFMDNGGITGFVMMQKVDDIQKDMEKIYKQQKEGKPIRLTYNFWQKIFDLMEAFNEAIENNARFATYRASRHYAMRTKARSAYDAKEITVNFNRKGAGSKTAGFKSDSKAVEDAAAVFGVSSQVLGEGRIFFNATVQAIATTFKNFRKPDGSLNKSYIGKWTLGYALPPFAFGLALPFINQVLASVIDGSDGDDDPYANLAEWTRRKNICIYIGNNNFVTIPIGQELAAFLTLGDIAAGLTYASNVRPVDKSWDDEILGVLNTFSPVDVDTKVSKGGIMEDPISEVTGRTFSVLAPLVAVEQNIGWTGRPIYREDRYPSDKYTPEYQMVYQSTNPVLVKAMEKLHELGGGDDIKRGKLEVNPAIVQYLWEQYTGGPGKVFSNTISLGKDVQDFLKGKDTDFNIRKIEGLKAFVQQGDDRTEYYRAQAKYRKYLEDAKELNDAVNGYKSDKGINPEHNMALEDITKGKDYVRMRIILDADKSLSKINKEANKAEGAERKRLLNEYNKQMKIIVDKLDKVGE